MDKKTENLVYDLSELDDIIIPVYTYSGYCTSHQCCGNKLEVFRTTNKHVDNCPKCGYYLFWRKDGV